MLREERGGMGWELGAEAGEEEAWRTVQSRVTVAGKMPCVAEVTRLSFMCVLGS